MSVTNKILYIFIFLFSIQIAYSFNLCNVDISEPWFKINDSSGKDLLIIDSQGDIYMEGQDHSQNNKDSYKSFVVGNSHFNSVTSKFGNFYQNQASLSGSGLIIKNNIGQDVAIMKNDGSIYTKGKGVYEESNANCGTDGNYCVGSVKETRDYYCDITGSKSGNCNMRVQSSVDCNNYDYYYCSGSNRYKMDYSCGSGNCNAANTFIQTCSASAPSYTSWSCSDIDTKVRTMTNYYPVCSPSGCSVSSSQVLDYQNCLSGQYCSGGSCYSYTYSWHIGTWSSCSVSCGGGIQSRSVVCKRNDGATVSDSYCPVSKPATSQVCNTQSCYTYSWISTTWSSCSVSCGGGISILDYVCKRSDGLTVSDSYCGGTQPYTTQSCNLGSCTASFSNICYNNQAIEYCSKGAVDAYCRYRGYSYASTWTQNPSEGGSHCPNCLDVVWQNGAFRPVNCDGYGFWYCRTVTCVK